MPIRVSQFGNEVWVTNPSRIRVTQIGNEVWIVPSTSMIRVSQIGTEVWRTVEGLPLTITGYADGQAGAYAINALSLVADGNADGFATVRMTDPQVSPIIAVMAI